MRRVAGYQRPPVRLNQNDAVTSLVRESSDVVHQVSAGMPRTEQGGDRQNVAIRDLIVHRPINGEAVISSADTFASGEDERELPAAGVEHTQHLARAELGLRWQDDHARRDASVSRGWRRDHGYRPFAR